EIQNVRPRRRDQRDARKTEQQPGIEGQHIEAYGNSIAIAVASPPPMHSAATPRFLPCLRSAPISVTTMRAPDAPIGWPIAHAPPCTFMRSCGIACSCIAAIVTTANASLTSNKSTSRVDHPVLRYRFAIAPTGAVVN